MIPACSTATWEGFHYGLLQKARWSAALGLVRSSYDAILDNVVSLGKINYYRSPHLEALIRSIKGEWKGRYRKSPDLAIFALQDERVTAAIEMRFAEQASITNIRQLEYDFHTGLHNLVFEFMWGVGNLGKLGSDAFLVILDGNGKVVALVDPFDPVQPNKFVPPLPGESEHPFVLDRAYVGEDVRRADEELFPMQVRSREFMNRLKLAPDIIVINETVCDYATQTPGDWKSDRTSDDCAADESILT